MIPFASPMLMVGAASGLPLVTGTTLDPDDTHANIALSGGNLIATRANTADSHTYSYAKVGKSSGKWRFQVTINTGPTVPEIIIGLVGGFQYVRTSTYFGLSDGISYVSDGRIVQNNVTVTSGYGTFTSGDVIDILVDATNSKMWVAKNGTIQGGGNPDSGTGGITISIPKCFVPAVGLYKYPSQVTCNFGTTAFTNTIPTASTFGGWSNAQAANRDTYRCALINIRSVGYFGHSFAEIATSVASLGTNQLSGGTATAQYTYASDVAAQGIDGNSATKWTGQTTGSQNQGPCWYKVDLAAHSSRLSRYLRIQGSQGGGGNELQAPTLFDVFFSHDGSAWSKGGNGRTVSAYAGTTPGAIKEIALPDLT